MACKYCDVKVPKEDAAVTIGKYPVGKPFFVNRDEYGIYSFAVINHENGCPAIPDEDEWRLNFIDGGSGHYITIRHCPHCGRMLGGDAS